MDKIIIDLYYNGVILDKKLTENVPLMQGQENSYELRIHFNPNYSISEMLVYSCLVNIERSDGEASNDIVCLPVTSDDDSYFSLTLSDWVTAEDGEIQITPKIRDNEIEEVLKTYGTATFAVLKSSSVSQETIYDFQYQAIIERFSAVAKEEKNWVISEETPDETIFNTWYKPIEETQETQEIQLENNEIQLENNEMLEDNEIQLEEPTNEIVVE